MRKIFIGVFIFFIFTSIYKVSAEDEISVNQYFDQENFRDVNEIFQKSQYGNDFDILKTAEDFISGKVELSPTAVFKYFIKNVFNEVFENISLIRNIIIICVLSAVIKNFAGSLKNKETGELAFYITYIVMVIALFSSFAICISIMKDTVFTIAELMKAAVPLIIGLLIMSGGSASAYLFSSVIFSAAEFIVFFIDNFAVPLIITAAVMQILNCLSEKEILSKFTELIKNCVSWGVKGCAIIFMGILSLQRMGGESGNAIFNKTAKFAMNMVPVVGDVFSGTIESFRVFSGVIKTGIVIAFILGIIILCAIPIIKIIAMIFIYKFTASIIQPVCDKRIVNCIDQMSKYTGVILGIVFMAVVVFIFAAIMVISVSGG